MGFVCLFVCLSLRLHVARYACSGTATSAETFPGPPEYSRVAAENARCRTATSPTWWVNLAMAGPVTLLPGEAPFVTCMHSGHTRPPGWAGVRRVITSSRSWSRSLSWVSNALARLPFWWGRYSVQRAPLSKNGEQVRDYHHKFEGGKAVSAVLMPPQAHRELQGKQNKTKQVTRRPFSRA